MCDVRGGGMRLLNDGFAACICMQATGRFWPCAALKVRMSTGQAAMGRDRLKADMTKMTTGQPMMPKHAIVH